MRPFLPLLALFSLSLFASAKDGWETNFEKAKAQAQTENKPMLLDFTGSDWCGWCKKLEAEVFSKKEWKDYAAKNLILVEVDFPQMKRQTETVKKQNEKLQQQYHIEGYPTIIVLSASGQKKGQLGYQPGGPAAFIQAVDKVK